MTVKYFAILTNQGAAKLANATALGTQIHITQMAVGDGNGSLPTPDPAQTQLVNQKRIGAVNTLTVDAEDTNQIIAEQVIPENEGGYWIRELGLFDDEGVLIAVANCPETYKPLLGEGSGRTQTIRMALIVSSTSAITLKIDPSVVLATRKYVDDKVIEVKAYSDALLSQHIAASNPHTQYAPIASPTLTGTPKAPTAAQTANDTQLATTAFVKAAISALVNGAPATLDTFAELAAALGNNPNFATTMANALAGKQQMDSTLTALSGKSIAELTDYLGLGSAAKLPATTFTNGTNYRIYKTPLLINNVLFYRVEQFITYSLAATSVNSTVISITFPMAYQSDVSAVLSDTGGVIGVSSVNDNGANITSLTNTGATIMLSWNEQMSQILRLYVTGIVAA